jgi:hypothetical protein
MVEFALILPVLVLLALGAVDVAKAINYWNDSTHLANEAARYAAVNNSPSKQADGVTPVPGSLNAAIANEADTQELRNSVSVIICDPPGSHGAIGDEIRVDVVSSYNWSAVLLPLHLNSNIRASSTMRLEKAFKNDNPSTDAYTKGTYDPGTHRCIP